MSGSGVRSLDFRGTRAYVVAVVCTPLQRLLLPCRFVGSLNVGPIALSSLTIDTLSLCSAETSVEGHMALREGGHLRCAGTVCQSACERLGGIAHARVMAELASVSGREAIPHLPN
jgi:hypothetical protein